MLSDRCRSALQDIVREAGLCERFIGDADFHEFASDEKTFYSAVRCLEIISEASRRLDPELTARHPEIPWRSIRSAGNIYRHTYDAVSASDVWDTAKTDLQALVEVCLAELKEDK